MRLASRVAPVALGLIFSVAGQKPAPAPARGTPAQLAAIEDYIHKTWHTLTRSDANLAIAAVDPKFKPEADGRWPVYVAQKENLAAVESQLKKDLSASAFAKIALRRLPGRPESAAPGLLYLPRPYVVPGGRFNEMYGWDSFFIQLGLLRDGETGMAKDMADNFLYEIRNYGKILNANRTYYLGRSQPPFLTQMLLGVYSKTKDKQWLGAAIPALESYYHFWTHEPHLTPETGLSRYFDSGEGPAPESVSDERDAQGRTHYDRVKEYLRTHTITDYDVSEYYNRKTDQLTPLFYKGDRSMRESGVDPSNRFGPFNIDIIHYDPVCLNSLLYALEQQTAEIIEIAGQPSQAAAWRARAVERKQRVNQLMWDSQDGLYYDYNFVHKRVRRYPYLTTFYPLWTGLAEPAQAARVAANVARFEQPGGLETSTFQSGNQWDAPFGWAPLQIIAIDGLRRYGYTDAADRLTAKFLSLVLQDFNRSHTIVEKYDVVRRATDVSGSIDFGYRSNEVGFGWTNGAFEQLYPEMSEQRRADVLRFDWPATVH